MAIRLDKLTALSVVTIEIDTGIEEVVFLGIDGEGDDRKARFLSRGYHGEIYEWAAYRYNGRWAYGTSGDRISVVGARTVNGAAAEWVA
jgi:hypothetical protein